MDDVIKKEFQVFFIVSHLDYLMGKLQYEISKKNKNITDLLERFCIKIKNKENVEFIVKVFSFSFEESNEKELVENIVLNGYGSDKFIGTIKFIPKKSNFIYDFSFDICHKDDNDIPPPENLKLSKCDQFNIFNKLLKIDVFKKDDFLFESLIKDSFYFLKDNIDYQYVDFYLSLLANCYLNKDIIELLSYFNLNKIKLSEKVDKDNFSTILNKIKISPDLITNHLDEIERREKYLEIFYTLLLFYRLNYETDKLNELFEENNINKYYIKILFSNKEYFIKIYLPNSFFDKVFESDLEMNYYKLILIFKYLKKFESILKFLNKYSQKIIEILEIENKKNNQEEERGEEEEEEEKEEVKNQKQIK